MKLVFCSILFVLLSTAYSFNHIRTTNNVTNKIVCYYGSWATYRHGQGKFDVEHIDARLCTHFIYTFLGLGQDGSIRVLDEFNDLEENWGKGAFKRFNNLREQNPKAKTIVAIGGWNEGSTTYSNVMASDALRSNFVRNAVEFVTRHGFDGFDLDWEYPNQRGGDIKDIKNFSKLLQEMRAAFDAKGLLLTAAVAAAEFSAEQSYEIPQLSRYLDFINVMTYDLHGPWDKVAGHNAPLYASSKDVTEKEKQLNVQTCINYWISQGADPAKIILGMGTYGRTFTLNNAAENGIGAPADNPGNGGKFTNQPGMLGYNEIVELQLSGEWTVVWDEEQQVPHMVKGNQWVGYDNPESIKLKVNFAKSLGLGGVMIWSIETDDFHGNSGSKYPLLYAINEALGNEIVPLPTTTTTTTVAPTWDPSSPGNPSTSTENPSGGDGVCNKEGYVRDPDNCSIFYYCIPLIEGGYKPVRFECSSGLVFDPVSCTCNYPWDTTC